MTASKRRHLLVLLHSFWHRKNYSLTNWTRVYGLHVPRDKTTTFRFAVCAFVLPDHFNGRPSNLIRSHDH